MAQINYIRHEVNQKGESYASVARRMGVDYRTVGKYANQEEFKVKKKQQRRSRVMDPVKRREKGIEGNGRGGRTSTGTLSWYCSSGLWRSAVQLSLRNNRFAVFSVVVSV